MVNRAYSIAVAVNSRETLENNLFLSPSIRNEGRNQIIIRENYPSASLAYNSAIDEADNEIIIFIHQDIYLPEKWFADLERSLTYLKEEDANWGVLGCFGSTRDAFGGLGRVYTTGLGLHGRKLNKPEPAESLDEIILIIRKSSGLRFDPALPHFHLYGTDLCMTARARGMTNYAIPAFCLHNTNQLLVLPREFRDCYRHIKAKWPNYLPIHTSCIKISRFDEEFYLRKIGELAKKTLGRQQTPLSRAKNAKEIIIKEIVDEELAE